MDTEKNKNVIRHWIEARNTNNLEAALTLFADHLHEQLKRGFAAVTDSFPDVQITIDDLIAENDKVVVRWTLEGTHQGIYRDIPATGKRVIWSGMDLFTVINGKITALIREADSLSLLQQLNVNISLQDRVTL